MRKIALALVASAALLTGPALHARDRLTPEQRLDKMLEGREAGEPVSCISNWNTRDMVVLDDTALVFGHGSTIWVNRPENPNQLDRDDVLLTRLHGSQFCKLDIVQTLDRSSHFPTGFISLGDFVPYRRVRSSN
jgi:hypothetical protein